MKLRLLGNRMAIKPDVITESEGGIVMVTEKSQKVARGTVVAVGPGHYDEKGKFIPTVVKEGDRITYTKDTGETMDVDGEDILFMYEESVLAILNEE